MSKQPMMTVGGTASPFTKAPRNYGDLQSQLAPPPQPEPPAETVKTVEKAGGIEGRVMPKYADGPLCDEHFPEPHELTQLTWRARHGEHVPFVGRGDDWQPLICIHSALPWRLGDHLVYLSPYCLKNEHERCLDQDCKCTCRGSDARQAVAQTESLLASALREVSGSLRGDVSAEILGRLDALESLRSAKDDEIAALRAELAARPAVVQGTLVQAEIADATAKAAAERAPDCQFIKDDGSQCKMHPKAGEEFCRVHKAKVKV